MKKLKNRGDVTPKHKARTLGLCAALHAFTHIYHVALMPLYLPIQSDLKLATIEQATLLLTVMMFSYFTPSYAMGVLADRFNRKKLLATGLAINSLGFVGLSFAPDYWWALLCVATAGFGGSFYHPAATSMIARLFPMGTGRALGLSGVGASIGFFIGPLYTGWRAATSGWRAPVLELGILGLLMAGLFVWLAEEEPARLAEEHVPHGKLFPAPALWLLFILASLCFGLRDFTGSSIGSLGSLFMQNAWGFNLKQTGMALSAIFIGSAVSNPLFGHLSDGGRLRWTCAVLLVAAVLVAVFPRVPSHWLAGTLAIYGFFFMASYPMVEAALMESVPEAVRGRVFGFFITAAGLVGNLSHWMVGNRVKELGARAYSVEGYYSLFTLLAFLLLLSLLGLPCLNAIRKREKPGGRPVTGDSPTGTGEPQFESANSRDAAELES